jgi:hypothetical protein
MAIYGYEDGEQFHDVQPLRLSEVTFQLPPSDLRRIADFLSACADEIESGTLAEGHRHLRDRDGQWAAAHPDSDVIVVPLSRIQNPSERDNKR